MTIDRYAVIGNPVAHSKSPIIQAAFAQSTGQALTYERLLAPRDGFVATVERFVSEGGKGLNITIPFKLEAFALAREHSARATAARACNTLAWRGDHWYGDNTDGAGLLRDLVHNVGATVAGRDVLVLGAGALRAASCCRCCGSRRSVWSSPIARMPARSTRDGVRRGGPCRRCRRPRCGTTLRCRHQRHQHRAGSKCRGPVAGGTLRAGFLAYTWSMPMPGRRFSSGRRSRVRQRRRTALACSSSRQRKALHSGAACVPRPPPCSR